MYEMREIGRVGRYGRGPQWIVILIALIIALFIGFTIASSIHTELLWFESFGFGSVYTKILWTRIIFGLSIGALVALFFFGNLWLLRNIVYRTAGPSPLGEFASSKSATYLIISASIFAGLLAGSSGSGHYMTFLRFIEKEPFGLRDPIFNQDLGFYVFSLPVFLYIYRLLLVVTVLLVLKSALVYFSSSFRGRFLGLPHAASVHLSLLLCFFFILKAWGFYLDTFQLLFSERGVVFGASYTDVHAQLPVYRILAVISLVCAVIMIVDLFVRGLKLTVAGVGALIVGWIVLGGIYPALVQRFQVEPNEIVRESPFIETNIRFTRLAYGLDKIEERDFSVSEKLSFDQIERNPLTVRNIRLWDYRPLGQTYRQLQGIRLYYDFPGIDIDRYRVDGRYTQVMLAAREINMRKLPLRARTWVNEHLKYTHGYGICMSPVNEVSEEGMPRFLIKDIPPEGHPELKVDRPEIYFGELTNHYVVVGTKTEEFDYPKGDKNAYTRYQVEAGIQLGSVWRKLIFAWRFRTLKMILSSDVTSQSRILYNRNIEQLVRKIAPFLIYDHDPYLVLSKGRLIWIYDAYTTTDMYPYSEPMGGTLNYIRNSVKITIDAYTGETRFYIFDEADPICRVYGKIFPELFSSKDRLPATLVAHIRYPERLFLIQASIFNTYHMQDPQVFYNKEDLWHFPTEVYEERARVMEPYYIIMKLPGEELERFLLMMPFTPANKNNMISWMAAHCDPDRYGELVLFKFPKQKLVYGPMQVEARIDQDAEISKQLTLWSQKGSRVIRGNLLVIPIEDDIMYAEPLYIHAEQSQLPELKRVIVSHGGSIAMEATLQDALARVFSGREEKPRAGAAVEEKAYDFEDVAKMLTEAQERLSSGDWVGFGEAMDRLKRIVEEMRK